MSAQDHDATRAPVTDFIRQIIAADVSEQRLPEGLVTRFPPEPNGYLHIGHAMSIGLNFGVGEEFSGRTFLRFDDTNPIKEKQEFADAIRADVRWLGYDWGDRLTHASDYFDQLYAAAMALIEAGDAYVDSLSAEEIREFRGTLTAPGRNSPYRDRSVTDNLDLFARMRAGEFEDGAHVLRAKIDMASPNINLRDPTLYRIRHATHQRTGDSWSIYPMYDFAHTLCDIFEGITHSLCTLEFEDHRPLYEWFVARVAHRYPPRQIEFSRLQVAYMVTSKRKLKALVDEGHVAGWDDPRMPTIAGLRRRGYPPAALRLFARRVGITKKAKVIELGLLESSVRDSLADVPRRMAVVAPLKVTISNMPAGETEWLTAHNHPNDPTQGERKIPLSRELWIELDDFLEDAPRKFFRLKPGGEVRLRYAYIIRCDEVIKDADGNVIELVCSMDPETRSGGSNDRKVKGTIHWVSAAHAIPASIHLYDRLFREAMPARHEDWLGTLNPNSLTVSHGWLEPLLADVAAGEAVQFERLGYFTPDPGSRDDARQFNRIVTLRDSWAKLEAQALQSLGQASE
ncbi:MAG: glutamine--tRNA ligase/YqeY domain fusion protein [Pseudomonadota bacterium]